MSARKGHRRAAVTPGSTISRSERPCAERRSAVRHQTVSTVASNTHHDRHGHSAFRIHTGRSTERVMLGLVTRETGNSRDYESTEVPATKEELLARVAQGDQRAFAALYDEVAPRVFGLVRRLLVDPAQSEEVTQEIFLEIWTNAARYEPNKGGATTWILTMAHRRAVDRIRASQASRDRDVKVGIRDYVAEYDHVETTVEVTIEHERVKRA